MWRGLAEKVAGRKKLFQKISSRDNILSAGAAPPVYPGLQDPASEGFPQLPLPWLHTRRKQMRDSVRRCKEAFLRTQAFGRENFSGAAPTSFVGRHLAEIDLVHTGLDSYAGAQAASRSASRQGALGRVATRAKLMRGLEAVGRTA